MACDISSPSLVIARHLACGMVLLGRRTPGFISLVRPKVRPDHRSCKDGPRHEIQSRCVEAAIEEETEYQGERDSNECPDCKRPLGLGEDSEDH